LRLRPILQRIGSGVPGTNRNNSLWGVQCIIRNTAKSGKQDEQHKNNAQDSRKAFPAGFEPETLHKNTSFRYRAISAELDEKDWLQVHFFPEGFIPRWPTLCCG